ncbi:vicilin-like seed storage protein At2g18540 [Morus notabilis]|uniref:vicilin-like seed storage protein At2g18540 n=1 Tax=Morus notabilis TaxID=981085 RepID=UPI000CED3382|nr:vicilin-like seed storage protein At2g18540 [Morus notabilis]
MPLSIQLSNHFCSLSDFNLQKDPSFGHGPCSPHHRFSHTEEAKMAGDRNGLMPEKAEGYSERRDEEEEKENERKSRKSRENSGSDSEEDRRKQGKSRRKTRESSDSDGERRKGKSRRRYSSKEDSSSGSESEYSDSESESSESEESESEGGRRKRKEKKRRREKEEERERKKRKREKERKRRRREREEERKKKEKRMKKKEKRRKKDRGKTGAVTNSWGKYGIIKETDMWNKRPEFTAWLAEVKQVNLESLPNWEEKQMFKEFMEDHNTATFPSKKYYNLDAYFKHKMEKDMKRGYKKIQVSERTVFNDEEQRRQELLREREKQKEAEVDALKRSMQSGMAQAMKEQAQLREEMVYQYKVGNLEAAAAIQRRLDPDVAM